MRPLLVLTAALLGLGMAQAAAAQDAPCLRPTPSFLLASGSMEPGLPAGSVLLVRCWEHAIHGAAVPPGPVRLAALRPGVERGDVVAYRRPGAEPVYVHRVIGLPGDRVQVRSGRLVLNGRPVERVPAGSHVAAGGDGPRPPLARYREVLPGGRSHEIAEAADDGPLDDTAEFVVPADHVFVLGDNRDHSLDSRVEGTSVPAAGLIGLGYDAVRAVR